MTATDNKSTHGGQREGAGRPALAEGDPTVKVTITIPQSTRDYLARLGDGNVSAGARRVVERDLWGALALRHAKDTVWIMAKSDTPWAEYIREIIDLLTKGRIEE